MESEIVCGGAEPWSAAAWRLEVCFLVWAAVADADARIRLDWMMERCLFGRVDLD